MSNNDVVDAANPRAEARGNYNERVKATTLCAKQQLRRVREVATPVVHESLNLSSAFAEQPLKSRGEIRKSGNHQRLSSADEISIAAPARIGVPAKKAPPLPHKSPLVPKRERPVSCRGGPVFALVMVASARFELTKS